MTQDLIDYSDIKTGKTQRVQAAAGERRRWTASRPSRRKMYETSVRPTSTRRSPGRRRRAAWAPTRTATIVWVGNSFGGTMARINIHTKEDDADSAAESRSAPALSGERRQGPQRVDQPVEHRQGRQVRPGAGKWTLFDLPNRGHRIAPHLSLLEREGKPMQVIVPYYARPQGGGDDPAQRSGDRGAQEPGRAAVRLSNILIKTATGRKTWASRFHERPVMMQHKLRRLIGAFAVAAASVIPLLGQDAWSQARTIRIVVPFPAGGSADILARLLGEHISKTQGPTVVIENRPGGGASIAYEAVARAAPDGNTLVINGKLDRHQSAPAESELRSSHELRADLLSLELAASDRRQQRFALSYACRIHHCCACQAWRNSLSRLWDPRPRSTSASSSSSAWRTSMLSTCLIPAVPRP